MMRNEIISVASNLLPVGLPASRIDSEREQQPLPERGVVLHGPFPVRGLMVRAKHLAPLQNRDVEEVVVDQYPVALAKVSAMSRQRSTASDVSNHVEKTEYLIVDLNVHRTEYTRSTDSSAGGYPPPSPNPDLR